MRGLDSATILGIEMLEPGQGEGDQKAEEREASRLMVGGREP